MTLTTRTLLILTLLTAASYAQTSQPKPSTQQPAQQSAQQPAPLRLQSLDPATQADPFPPVDPRNFTADTPTPTAVDRYLHAVIGYDANRIWRVESITKTKSPGVTRVSALISERAPNAKVLNATFYVLPDGKHLIADGTGVTAFGDNPYAENAAVLRERADGPAHGAAAKDFLLVEFADLQCPHCKDAQATMARLATDFPNARIVYQSFPIAAIHPYAFRAAACQLVQIPAEANSGCCLKREPGRRLLRLGVGPFAERGDRHQAPVRRPTPSPMRAGRVADVGKQRVAKLRRHWHAPALQRELALAVRNADDRRRHVPWRVQIQTCPWLYA